MKLSVCITTYNHADTIRQALDSVLAQRASFDFEVLVGEDDSDDGTREIVREYASRHPDKIRLFLHRREDVIYIDGRPTGRRNFVNNFENTRGEYVALLDGDDYWTDPEKLEKQVRYLDAHPECAVCFHRSHVLRQDGTLELHSLPYWKEQYGAEDLLSTYTFITMASVVLRNGLIGKVPEWFMTMPYGDLCLYVLNAQHGWIRCLPEVMSAYRISPKGVWSGLNEVAQMRAQIRTHEHFRSFAAGKYAEICDRRLRELHAALEEALQPPGAARALAGRLRRVVSGCARRLGG